ncbi:MAG TPA: PTS sugar transporter subunit IIC [Anaerovoracaceae bacterium]|nr:PTS sugar transporter subunit IIC [Anaerovoracaceae bacterium]
MTFEPVNCSLFQGILVMLITTCCTWWFSHAVTRTWLYPIWSGFLVGLVMGAPIQGMMIAAAINLPYVGFITAGGSMPGNPMFAGPVGTALALVSGLDVTLATTVGVILGSVAILSWSAYMTINSFWVHIADKFAAKGNLKMVRVMNYVPSFFVSLVINGIPALLVCTIGASFGEWLQNFPKLIIDAFNVVGMLMPALGIGMLLQFLGKKKLMPFFFLGFFLTVYFGLNTMAIAVLAIIVGMALYLFEEKKFVSGGAQ